MANESKFLESWREVINAEKNLNDFRDVTREAFKVFSRLSTLEEISKRFKIWERLFEWYEEHRDAPYLELPMYEQKAKEAFDKLVDARMNRDEFENFFAELKATVEAYEKELEKQLSEKRQELDQCYASFAKTTGELQFIFEAPCVKETIMNKLLRPQTVEEEE